MSTNNFLLAADNSPILLSRLRLDPTRAAEQDEHGYSLVHAAASYNHLDLLRTLICEFKVDVNIRDEDNESPLFVVETVEAAKVLVEELGADTSMTGTDGLTARQKIEAEGDYPAVAEYLKQVETGNINGEAHENGLSGATSAIPGHSLNLPPVPEGLSVTVATMAEADVTPDEPDPEFKRRIEQLAQRADFHSVEGQAVLRQLVEDAIAGEGLTGERNVRQRQD